MVRKSDDLWCLAEVIQKRQSEQNGRFEYYVHYDNFNRFSMSIFRIFMVFFFDLYIFSNLVKHKH